eukprot:s1120_g8.t1
MGLAQDCSSYSGVAQSTWCKCRAAKCTMRGGGTGTVRVFGQASLPLVGVSTALFFKRRYTLQQWCSLIAVSLGLVTFYFVKAEVAKREGQEVPSLRWISLSEDCY